MKKRERFFKNGVLNENKVHLIKKIAELVKDNKGSTCKLSSEQVMEMYEESVEFKNIA